MHWLATASRPKTVRNGVNSKELESPYYRSEMTDRNSLCLKFPDLRSVGDNTLNPPLRKSKHE